MKRYLPLCLLLFCVPLVANAASDPVLDKFAQRYFGWHDLCADLQLEVEHDDGERTGSANACVMLDKDMGYMRMTIESPHVMKGTVLISHVTKDGKRKQWLYMLATRRAIQIASHKAEQPFLGTDFTYVDLSLNLLDPAQLTPAGKGSCDHDPCRAYDIRSNKNEYLRRIWLMEDSGALDHVDIFDQGKKIKVLEVEDEARVGKYYLPSKLEMTNLSTGGETTVKWSNAKLDQGLKVDYFDPTTLAPASGRPH